MRVNIKYINSTIWCTFGGVYVPCIYRFTGPHEIVYSVNTRYINSTRGTSSGRVQELCESRGGRPGLSVLTSLLVSVDVKQYRTMFTHWSQLVPNVSTDIRGHEALLHHHHILWWSLCTLCCIPCTSMPDESYRRRLRVLLLYLCYVFRVLILCWFLFTPVFARTHFVTGNILLAFSFAFALI